MSSIIDIYQRSYELVAANRNLSIATPFTSLFLRQTPVIDTGSDQVTIELYKGNRKVAPLVSRRNAGKDIDDAVIRPGISGANDYLYALASQDFELPAGTLNKRAPGEDPFIRGMSGDDVKLFRQRYWMNTLAIDATRRVIMRNELLAKQAFFDSEMNIGDLVSGASKLVFPRTAALKARTVAVSWATAGSAKPWTDLGNAQKAVKSNGQIDGRNTWVAFLGSAPMENLRAIYRSQRTTDIEPIVNNSYKFDPEQGAPAELAFLIENGMEYCGWVRSDYSSSKIHLFTLPEGYDATADDSGTSYTDFISGDTIALCAYSPDYFKAYYGPGKKSPPMLDFYTANFPAMSMPSLPATGLTIGASGLPARSLILNVYPLGRNEGMGGTIEHAPIYAPLYPDVVATIATTTAT